MRKEARLKEMEELGTGGMLLTAVALLGDERVSGDRCAGRLIIPVGGEPDDNPGA